ERRASVGRRRRVRVRLSGASAAAMAAIGGGVPPAAAAQETRAGARSPHRRTRGEARRMAATDDGSLTRRAALAACLLMTFAARSPAQPQPVFVPAPAGPEFLSRYDFHLNVDSLSPPKDTPAEIADERFSWDTHFGGSFDVVDLIVGRAG